MAIVFVNEVSDQRSGPIDDAGIRTYVRTWQVKTDSALDGPLLVRTATGIPQPGAAYETATEFDFGARVKRVEPVQDGDNAKLWLVTVTYDTRVTEWDNPLDEPPEVAWTFAQFQKVAFQDIDGNAVINSAGQYFDPPVEIDDSRPVLTITRNEASYNAAAAIAYQDAVNSDSFFGFSAGQVKVSNISAVSVVQKAEEDGGSDFLYWRVTYEFMMRREGWTLKLLDQGRYKINEGDEAGDIRLTPILDDAGNPVTDPVPLDGDGQPIEEPGPTNCHFEEFTVYKSLPFSAFGF